MLHIPVLSQAIEDESPSPHPAAPDGHQSALKYYTCRPKTKTKAAPSADLPSSSPQPSVPPDHSAPLPSGRVSFAPIDLRRGASLRATNRLLSVNEVSTDFLLK